MSEALVWLSQALITAEMSRSQREERLAPLFEPRPGKMLEIPRKELADTSQDPLFLKGEIWVKPPKGTCLRIRKDLDKPDLKICRPQPITWHMHEIDPAGKIQRLIIAGNPDEGTLLTWSTPYRMANFVEQGKKESGEDQDIPIMSCDAQQVEETIRGKSMLERSIILTLAKGRRWRIDFPPQDTMLPPPKKPEPVLEPKVAAQGEAKHEEKPADDGHSAPAEKAAEKPAEKPAETPPEKSRLAKLLSGEKVDEEKVAYYFRVAGKEVFEMPSSFFREGDSPGGLPGKCRYKFKGAAYDPDSGVIECYETHSMDAVYVHVPCMSKLTVLPVAAPVVKEKAKEQAKSPPPKPH